MILGVIHHRQNPFNSSESLLDFKGFVVTSNNCIADLELNVTSDAQTDEFSVCYATILAFV
jgi:hypothetical protein